MRRFATWTLSIAALLLATATSRADLVLYSTGFDSSPPFIPGSTIDEVSDPPATWEMAPLGLPALAAQPELGVFFPGSPSQSLLHDGTILEGTISPFTRTYANGIARTMSTDPTQSTLRASTAALFTNSLNTTLDVSLVLALYNVNAAPEDPDPSAGAMAAIFLNNNVGGAPQVWATLGDTAGGFQAPLAPTPAFTMNAWHLIGMELNYDTNLVEFFIDDPTFTAPFASGTMPSALNNDQFARAELWLLYNDTPANRTALSDFDGNFDRYVVEVLSDPAGVPEPSSIVLAGIGLVSMAGAAWRRRKTAANTAVTPQA